MCLNAFGSTEKIGQPGSSSRLESHLLMCYRGPRGQGNKLTTLFKLLHAVSSLRQVANMSKPSWSSAVSGIFQSDTSFSQPPTWKSDHSADHPCDSYEMFSTDVCNSQPLSFRSSDPAISWIRLTSCFQSHLYHDLSSMTSSKSCLGVHALIAAASS